MKYSKIACFQNAFRIPLSQAIKNKINLNTLVFRISKRTITVLHYPGSPFPMQQFTSRHRNPILFCNKLMESMTSSDHRILCFPSLNVHRENSSVSDIYSQVEPSFPFLPAFLLKIWDLDLKQQCGCSCSPGTGKWSPFSVPVIFVISPTVKAENKCASLFLLIC